MQVQMQSFAAELTAATGQQNHMTEVSTSQQASA
jgi:hypothetical protein